MTLKETTRAATSMRRTAATDLTTPFLNVLAFSQTGSPEVGNGSSPGSPASRSDGGIAAAVRDSMREVATPFAFETGPLAGMPTRETTFYEILAELEDADFDDAVAGLVAEAHEIEHRLLAGEIEGEHAEIDSVLQVHFAPLIQEAEAMLDRMATAANDNDLAVMSETQIEEFFAPYDPAPEGFAPSFEHFLKKLFKKAKKAVKKVAGGVRKVARKAAKFAAKFSPVALVLKKLRRLVKPLIQRVLSMALNKLPVQLRPLAKRLARRFLRESEFIELQGEHGDTAVHAVHRIQQELDFQLAELVTAESEAAQDELVARFVSETVEDVDEPVVRLDTAREVFMERFENLDEGASAQPAVEEFVPAVLGALRLGVRLIGRPRVVKFLSGLVARMIQGFVGRQSAPALSRAVVDAGLRLVNLEATETDEQHAGGRVIADTIEETVRRITALDDYILDDEILFEEFALRSFEDAVAAHFPPDLILSELRETSDLGKAFQPVPSGRYLKYPVPIRVELTPDKARAVASFGNESLERFLQRVHGIEPGTPVSATAELFQARPGTWLSQVAATEGLPGGARRGWQLLHPLNVQAAGILLGRPGLGMDVNQRFAQTRHRIAVGQRFYVLRLAKAPRPAVGRASELNVVLDLRRSQLRSYVFVSEAQAQAIAARIRARDDLSTIASLVSQSVRALLEPLRHHLKIVPTDGIVFEEQAVGTAAGQPIVGELTKALTQWLLRRVTQYFRESGEEFVRAADSGADGVTLAVVFDNPAGLGTIREALRGNVLPLIRRSLTLGAVPEATVRVIAGFTADE